MPDVPMSPELEKRCPHCGYLQRGPRGDLWSQEDILEKIRQWYRIRGRPPIYNEWKSSPEGYPNADTVRVRFGSWNAAIEAAGLPPRPHGHQAEVPGGYRRNSRARQMVTGGSLGAKRYGPGGGYI